MNVDNFVEMVDLSDKLVQKFSTKSMFERIKLVEKLQKSMTFGKRGQDVM